MNESRRNFLRVAAAAPVAAVAPQALAALPNLAGAGGAFGSARGTPLGGYNSLDELMGAPKWIHDIPRATVDFWEQALWFFGRSERAREDWHSAYQVYRKQPWKKPWRVETDKGVRYPRDPKFVWRLHHGIPPRMKQEKTWPESVRDRFNKLPEWAKDPKRVAACFAHQEDEMRAYQKITGYIGNAVTTENSAKRAR
jgi:hypothetical protein